MPHFIEDLTEAQRSAVLHTEGPLLILAGPGSGKTRVVTCRIAHMLEQQIPDGAILALTFTNKAADEMRQRLASMVRDNYVWLGTYHRFCSRLLREAAPLVGLRENFTIYDAGDSLKLLKQVIEEDGLALTHFSPSQIQQVISNAKNRLWDAEQLRAASKSPMHDVAARYYEPYQERLISANAVDFDDLLMYVARLLIENGAARSQLDSRYQFILVDEYQDTNYAQYQIVRAMSVEYPNLAVTGDPDQSIYGWRGADIRNILSFEADYPDAKIVRLEQNYRSTPEILHVADTLISNNQQRKPKKLFTENPSGPLVRLVKYEDEQQEAYDIADQVLAAVASGERRAQDHAILYRVNALSRALEHALRERGIAYQIVNGVEFYQRKEIKDILAYLHLVNNRADRLAFQRIINTPPRGIGKKTVERLSHYADRNRLTLLEAAQQVDQISEINKRSSGLVRKFVGQFEQIAAAATEPVEEIVGLAISVSDYRDHLTQSGADEDLDRLANIEELLTASRQFDAHHGDEGNLELFLEQAALVNDTDAFDNDTDKVTLMTMHAAKGLEFPAVFIVAVESDILPHSRAKDDPNQLEEERRLLFVGVTRAKRYLQFSFTRSRNYRGRVNCSVPSAFLQELPRESMEQHAAATSDRYSDRHFDHSMSDWEPPEELPEEHSPTPPVEQKRPPKTARVTTAAALAGEAPVAVEKISPDAFQVGMLVSEPKHGLGKIIALSGAGKRRRATVQFVHPPEQRKFMLAQSELRPTMSE